MEQAHNAVYSSLHHLRSFHGDAFNWAELLPSVAYMHNTAVQTHKSESPMFQRDGRDNRLANADTLVTDEVLHKDEYRRRFDASFGTNEQEEQQTQDGLFNSTHDSDAPLLTNAYEARQERAAVNNARAVQRNQHRMNKQSAQDDVLFGEGNTVLVLVPQRCRTKLDPATILGCVWSEQIIAVERQYRIATQAGVLSRLLRGTDLATRTDGVVVRQSDYDTMASASKHISLQHAVRCASGRTQTAQLRATTSEQRTRLPPGGWWRSS